MEIMFQINKRNDVMINLEEILVIKDKNQIIIGFNGSKLFKSINGFEDKSEDEIKSWFIKEVLNIEEVK